MSLLGDFNGRTADDDDFVIIHNDKHIDNLTDFIGSEPSKKRKRRTSFTPAALEVLNNFFEINTHPSGRF